MYAMRIVITAPTVAPLYRLNWFLWRGFEPSSGHMGFVVDKAAPGQVFSEYFGFSCQAFYLFLHTHHHPSSSGAGTIGQ
jgi:hypothetical protein